MEKKRLNFKLHQATNTKKQQKQIGIWKKELENKNEEKLCCVSLD